jgi:hypothetical protein
MFVPIPDDHSFSCQSGPQQVRYRGEGVPGLASGVQQLGGLTYQRQSVSGGH